MGVIAGQLEQLLVQSIPTIVFVIFLVAFLNRLFFKPLSRTLDARANATSGALAKAQEQIDQADAKLNEYDQHIQSARQEIYRHREEARRKFLGERDNMVQAARARADGTVNDAQADLDKQTAQAKSELKTAVEALANEVTVALFSPHVAGPGAGGLRA
ncbi:MAG TPA: ATP synthase F0 subunit B [Terriglobia bacterium]|nr:ATP synthase F0 subunit B [Terriglobia bacterium]